MGVQRINGRKSLQDARGFICTFLGIHYAKDIVILFSVGTSFTLQLHAVGENKAESCGMYWSQFLEMVGQRDTLSINETYAQSQTT